MAGINETAADALRLTRIETLGLSHQPPGLLHFGHGFFRAETMPKIAVALTRWAA
jgi:hypothetical protein